MRVISGNARGRRLRTVKGHAVRPTASKVKGAIFNMLASRFDLAGADVLDLFAGAGSLGIEALSRGAERVTFIENAPAALQALRGNLEQCGYGPRARLFPISVLSALRRFTEAAERFDGVLLDPPYGQDWVPRTLEGLARGRLVRPGGWIVAEHGSDDEVAESYGGIRLTQHRRYGKTAVALFSVDEESEAP